MSADTELLLLRLALIGVIFLFVAFVALTLRGSVGRPTVRQTQAVPRQWRLVVVRAAETGFARGAEFPLSGSMVVGRDPAAGIVLPDASVSMRHARIERVEAGWKVTDLGSTNGTFVDGRRVGAQGAVLRKPTTVAFGSVVLQLAGV